MMQKSESRMRVALVTGASRGIGRGIALALAGKDWRVAVNYHRNLEAARETQRQIEAAGSQAALIQADIARHEDRQRLVEQTLERFGRIDLLVNNAGIGPEHRADLLELSEESYERVMAVNLKGPFFLTQLAARTMIALLEDGTIQAPKIVNIGSLSTYAASVERGEYCLSKAGLGMMTALFATRLAEYGILVYEIRPGIVATDMTQGVQEKYERLIASGVTPIRRWGRPQDVAKAVLAIAEGCLPFSTGEVINVDGGFHLPRL
ncbi:MAG: 3-ketoacyl-ACP reductase [Anaerolineales bacterium]